MTRLRSGLPLGGGLGRTAARLTLALALVALAGRPARAGDPIALQSFTSDRPADAALLLRPLFDELASRGFVVRPPELGPLIERRLSMPADALDADQLALARQLILRGQESWIAGNFDDALRDLERGLDLLRGGPTVVARDQTLRDLVHRALVTAALAHHRRGNAPRARALLAETARSYPEVGVPREIYGPEAAALYRREREGLDRFGRGSLRVDVDDPHAVVFVNERFVGVGATRLADLLPGLYRVFALRGERAGRLHLVEVTAGTEQALAIQFGLDAALRTRDVVGFAFASATLRQEHEAAYAAHVARAVGADGVVVVSVHPVEGGTAVAAALVSVETGTALRAASVALGPRSPAATQLRALAEFLGGEPPAPGLEVVVGPAPAAAIAPSARSGSPRRVLGWAGIGVGVAAGAAGAWLIGIDGDGTCELGDEQRQCRKLWRTLPLGVGVATAGGLVLGAGVYLLLGDDDGAALTLQPQRDGLGASVSGRF